MIIEGIIMEKLLTAREVAELLNCHIQSVYRNDGLPYINLPSVGIRFRKSDIERYLKQNTIESTSLLTHKNPHNSFKLTDLGEFDKLYLKQNKELQQQER